MKIFYLFLLLALLLAGCSEAPAPRSTIKPGQLQIGLAPPYPPFVENKPLRGLDVALARAIARAEKLQPRLRAMSFSALLPALRNKKIDIALSGLVPTPERSSGIVFSEPYLERTLLLFGKDAGPLGVIRDSAAERRADDSEAFPTRKKLLEAFLSGRVQGILIDQREAALEEKLRNMRPTKRYPLGEMYVVALAEESEGLQNSINKTITRLRENGKLDTIISSYLGKYAQDE